ncbi:MAG TPA: TIGR03118 family protein [Gaiellales bacterium]|nr:TIGR03118 family protein [Gaiellales bacterium]
MRRLLTVGVLAAAVVLSSPPAFARSAFRETNLVSDLPAIALVQDTLLVNPWGIVAGPHGDLRIADNGVGVSTLYSGAGDVLKPVFTIPPPGGGTPTGILLNRFGNAFMVTSGDKSGRSRFILASEDGSISAWSPEVDPDNAIQVASTPDAVYKGIAEARTKGGAFLFATNFHAGVVDVFDQHFAPVSWEGAFVDTTLPSGYAPFGIANFGGDLFITYAKQKPDRHDDEAGAGFGFIDVFDTRGHLLRRLVSQDVLDAPWGMAMAPEGFGDLGGALLVGNFGDGRINAFDPRTGEFKEALSDSSGDAIVIEGLWGLTFARGSKGHGEGDDEDVAGQFDDGDQSGDGDHSGDGGHSGDGDHAGGGRSTLYFTAGIDDESHGLFGVLRSIEGGRGHRGDDDSHHGEDERALQVTLIHANPARLTDPAGVQWRVSSVAPAIVTLRLYDTSGRLIAEPLRDLPLSGAIVAGWDLRDRRGVRVAAGTYFYRGTTAAGAAQGRLVLLH